MILCFELTMPNNNSWNSKWTGDKRKHYEFRHFNQLQDPGNSSSLSGQSFRYNFGDGWAASIHVDAVDGVEKRKRQKVNDGFCGYSWMVDEIMKYGRIKTLEERRKSAVD